MHRLMWILALLVVAVAGSSASASVAVYTTSAAFNAAGAGSLPAQNFDGGPTGSTPIVVGGITITSISQSTLVGSALYGSGNSLQWSTNAAGSTTLTFLTPITAFAADFFDVGTVGATTLTAALNNGDNAVLFSGFTGASGNLQFRGFISTTPFTSITFTNTASGDFVELDNVRFGTAIVPEPATMAVFGLMAVGAFGVRRRLKAAA